MSGATALDVFAGVGWGVACQWLGVCEYGVEIAPSVIRLRAANGMRTIYRDVWSGLRFPWLVPPHRLYIASPPCQTFSIAGTGEGRRALGDVLNAIHDGLYMDVDKLIALGERLDPRTALVLAPLAHIWRHRPELVALEQVPEVLPVWHAYARVMRGLGYSVHVEVMRAEQYGVPQTRKRAILMARLDGKVQPPVPTHSRYYSTDPGRLDPGVEKWVSMADALDRGMTARPYPTIASGRSTGGPDKEKVGGSSARRQIQEELKAGRWKWEHTPSTTIAGDPRITAREHHEHGEQSLTSFRLTLPEAAALQTFPPEMVWTGTQTAKFMAIGNAVPPLMAAAILGALLAPPAESDAWDSVFAEVAG